MQLTTAVPPAWGVQYTLNLPTEGAARAAAAELSGMGHRLTAVRVHGHFRFVPWEESAAAYLTRQAIGRELPTLLSRWEDESDAARFALAALTALCGTRDRRALSGSATLPAPAGSSRADVVSLVAALLSDDREGWVSALDRLASWLPGVAEKAAGPQVDLRSLGLALLPDLVFDDVASGITAEREMP
ncbi:hypothetical protein [Streptomyces sp. NPDC006477]|uniref:hypothetical protein n=1 Tax=Streptomyces sp. NPDC006477 TaxID=3364747 RepID=UPI003685916D